jgi:rubredoxin
MGEFDIYYVPKDQARWNGRKHKIEQLFCPLGVILHDYDRLKEINAELSSKGERLPKSKHQFSFGGMGVADEDLPHPVPNELYDNWSCPQCSSRFTYEDLLDGSEKDFMSPDDVIACGQCGQKTAFENLKSDTNFIMARTYIFISDVDPEEWIPMFLNDVKWDTSQRRLIEGKDPKELEALCHDTTSFKDTVEQVLGPCDVYSGWST